METKSAETKSAFKQALLRRGFNDQTVAVALSRSRSKQDSATTTNASILSTDDTSLDLNAVPSLNHLHVAVWLEAVDPHHRYSKSLMKYFRYWQNSSEPLTATTDTERKDTAAAKPTAATETTTTTNRVDFFTWLDFGGGRHLDLPWCPRRVLDQRRVKYMNLEERSWFEVIINTDGLLCWKLNGGLLHTPWSLVRKLTKGHLPKSGTWIFVLSQQEQLYVGQKIKGRLHHSSFTAGAPTNAAGNIRCNHGRLIGLKPQSGHYRPNPIQWKQAMESFLLKGGVTNYEDSFPSNMRSSGSSSDHKTT